MSYKKLANGGMATGNMNEFDMDSNDFNSEAYLEKLLKVNEEHFSNKCWSYSLYLINCRIIH